MNHGLGRLLLYRARPYDLVDYAILFQTCARAKDAYVHSAFLYPDGKRVIESCFRRGVQQRAFNDGPYCDQFSVKGMTAANWANVLYDAERELGTRYDTRGILRFVTRHAGADDGHWFCSELTQEKLTHEGFPILSPTRALPWQVAPNHQGMSNAICLEKPL